MMNTDSSLPMCGTGISADRRRSGIEFDKRSAKRQGLTLAAFRAKRAALLAELRERSRQSQLAHFERLRPIPPMREPLYLSFVDYLFRTTEVERKARWRLCARGNGLHWSTVNNVFFEAHGRCCYCDSLAVERTPQLVPWGSIGRRLGSLEHRDGNFRNNAPDNLAWACMSCNTHPEERIPNARCHGAIDRSNEVPIIETEEIEPHDPSDEEIAAQIACDLGLPAVIPVVFPGLLELLPEGPVTEAGRGSAARPTQPQSQGSMLKA